MFDLLCLHYAERIFSPIMRPVNDKNTSNTQSGGNDSKVRLIILITLAIITLIALLLIVWSCAFNKGPGVLDPDYAIKDEEPNVEDIGDGGGDKLESPDGGGAVSLTYSKKVKIDLSDKKASLHFGNPSKSNQDLILELVVKDTVIIQSGRISPGKRVTRLDLDGDAHKMLATGGYVGTFVIYYYNPETGERAVLDTKITEIQVEVRA